ncbi:hypothetical protein LshimejAT787_0212490 [Lyophyllum shimeji]|uniref:Uncharacterized protein n=1 Tax=Lyophyllum shimeji TaxID=47721 RepID=A0A9P3PHS2_LYOSH|nr:hypothetical protein LshimejAT787_0212490 [Lyophyllum shimeji]
MQLFARADGFTPVNVDQTADCGPSSLDWAILVLTVITTHVTWWATHIPTIFREGIRTYLEDVAWECLRFHEPGYVGLVSSMIAPREEWQAKYYTGRTKELSKFKKYVSPFIIDSSLVVSSILSVYRLCNGLRQGQDLSGWNSSLWCYPSLPVALTGIWIVIASRLQLRVRFVLLGQLLMIAGIGAAIALAVHYNDPGRTNIWIGSTVIFAVMGTPLAIIVPQLSFMVIVLAAVGRSVGPIAGALSTDAYFPFCALRGTRFGAPLITFTVLACLFAMYGMVRTWKELMEDTRQRLARREARKRAQMREREGFA